MSGVISKDFKQEDDRFSKVQLSSEEGLEKNEADGKSRQEAPAVIETRADSDLNWILAVEMESSGLIQK